MLTFVAPHLDSQPERLTDIPCDWVIWKASEPIGHSYKILTTQAVDEGWGHETIIVQDDVRFAEGVKFDPHPPTDLMVHGKVRVNHSQIEHACPRAFSASPAGWQRLEEFWMLEPNTLCEGFRITLNEMGMYRNVTTCLR